ncbi:CNH domain-containing protein [Collybia nuda]|uniref:CNH domain-containing protein n=1 Tax=Collybia nuda TaxID=64659 RepID=A0A9P6CH88_9AGAR|nr:CNH domain-containing protein [Collybia nuda]
MPNPRPNSPVDEDLQQLYNEVWASFADEAPAVSSEGDLDNIYNVYSGENNQPSPNQSFSATSPTGSQSYAHGASSRVPPRYQQEAPSPKVPRRLPPTPGGSSATSSPTTPYGMPEPEPYHELGMSQRPGHHSIDSYTPSTGSQDLLRKATAGSTGGRRLPAAPAHMNGSRLTMTGLPSDPRPPVRVAHTSYESHSSSSTGGSYTTSISRESSYRPPGALPPTIPGRHDTFSSVSTTSSMGFDYDPDSRSNYSNGHYSDKYHYQLPTPDSSSSLGIPPPPPLPRKPSREYLPGSTEHILPSLGFTTSTEEGSQYGGYTDPRLQRNGSGSSQVGYLTQPTSSTRPPYNPDQMIGVTPMPSAIPSFSYNQQPAQDQECYDEDIRPTSFPRRATDLLNAIGSYDPQGPLELRDGDEDEYWEEEEEEDPSRFINFSLLSHMAVQLRDKVPRGTHVKGSIPYPRAFTGKDIVSTIQSQIQRELAINHNISTSDRRAALQVARGLQSQLFFYEVEWGSRVLQDGVEDVYMFLDDQEGGSDAIPEQEELPTGVVTMLTRCYSPSCGDGGPCYAYACPRKGDSIIVPAAGPVEAPVVSKAWTATIDAEILRSLPESEINRQTIIHKVISKEEQYIQDLDIVETDFIKPLRSANPPVLPPSQLEEFIDDVFGNILDLRECNRRLLEVMYVRQREQAPIIQRIGDIFLDAATEFRLAYPIYIGHHPIAEKRMKDELDTNHAFRLFLEQCSRQSSRQGESLRLDLKHFLNRPSEHLQKYPVLLEAIHHETAVGNPDADYLLEAVEAIKNLQSVAQLRTFQSAMGKGTPGKWEWHDLVSAEIRQSLPKDEAKRQSIIFELIKGEMSYVKDLENIENMYIIPLRNAEPPIIPRDRIDQFIHDVFHNFAELYGHHRRLVDKFHEIQREEHPTIHSITAAVFDAALNFREAYMEYIPNYPIAAYRIDDEMANNLPFKTFVDQCIRHPDAHRLDMKNFINRPIPRLLRYELLLKGILEETKPGHEDIESIPHVIDVIKALGKETEPGVFSAKQKVELWRYNSNLVFKPGESIDMDLLDQNRSLIHSGKLLRQPDSGLEWNGWSELFVLLFDNYMVMTKTKEKDGHTRYLVNRRPIPLDLLTLVNVKDPPTQRSAGLLRNLRGERHVEGPGGVSTASPETANDSRLVFPLTLHHNGRLGGPYVLYAETAQARTEWKSKIEEALGLRKVVQESNKVFEVETLSADTFLVPSMIPNTPSPAWTQDTTYTGKVTCSVPFNTPDGRVLVAIGCAEGVWIGFRHDPKSMRRVLHLKMVTQCAMLEEFGIFLVLADKSLFAYHIEALVPSSPHTQQGTQVPQKLNGTKDVHFFSVGSLHGRTLIIYMKKKGLESIFRVLEPVNDKINERVKAPVGLSSRLGFRSAKSEWFRVYRDFFLPTESFDLIFLKARIVVLCAKGFEIMDLNDFKSVTIPLLDDPRVSLAKRCESCRPMGMFRSADDQFLLCYDEFGLYVDKHGDPGPSPVTIEWEGTAERVALHLPYVLIFDTRFIEVRHIETGRLAQIIPGNDVRCLWDGRGVGSSVTVTPAKENGHDISQEAQVHAVMNAVDTPHTHVAGNRPLRVVAQNVVELIPTIPIYLPESLSSPTKSSYPTQTFTQASYFSSPTTPETMRNSQAWR